MSTHWQGNAWYLHCLTNDYVDVLMESPIINEAGQAETSTGLQRFYVRSRDIGKSGFVGADQAFMYKKSCTQRPSNPPLVDSTPTCATLAHMPLKKQSKPHESSGKNRKRATSLPARSSRASKSALREQDANSLRDDDEWQKMKEELTLRAFRIAYENHQRNKA